MNSPTLTLTIRDAVTIRSADTQIIEMPSVTESKTIEIARLTFLNLAADLNRLEETTLLPEDKMWPEITNPSLKETKENIHWTETVDAILERDRLETPSLNAVLRLCYLSTIDGKTDLTGEIMRMPFAEHDLAAFVESKTTRNRTYRWFKLGMIPAAILSGMQGFTTYIVPSIVPNAEAYQGVIITATSTLLFALGVIFTGLHPDISQDKLNEKIDKLNRVKEKLDEVARTLIIFCFYKKEKVRKLAQVAAQEIEITNIEKAATLSQKYAISKQDIAPSLELLKQSIDYIQKGTIPENHELCKLIQSSLIRKTEFKANGEWEPS